MQLPRAVERLKLDPDSRQAVVSIWDPLYDMQDTRDLPCTLNFNFRIRNDKLNMSTTMRSNDVWLGAAYDVFMFTQLQCTVANALGVEVGTYTHHAYSFHIYERNVEAMEQLHDYDPAEAVEEDAWGTNRVLDLWDGFGYACMPMEQCMARARNIYDGAGADGRLDKTARETWYERTLEPYSRLTAAQNFTS
jgi:thymidylate synthase